MPHGKGYERLDMLTVASAAASNKVDVESGAIAEMGNS